MPTDGLPCCSVLLCRTAIASQPSPQNGIRQRTLIQPKGALRDLTKLDEPILTGPASVKVMLRPASSEHRRSVILGSTTVGRVNEANHCK